MASKLVCPFMSARVTAINDPTSKTPTITPTVVTCQEEGCAIWDQGNKVCAFLSFTMEMVKSGEDK